MEWLGLGGIPRTRTRRSPKNEKVRSFFYFELSYSSLPYPTLPYPTIRYLTPRYLTPPSLPYATPLSLPRRIRPSFWNERNRETSAGLLR